LVGAPVVVGRRRGGGLTNVVEAAAQNSSARAAAGAAKKRGPQFPRMCRVCPRPGRPDYAGLVSGTEPAMVKVGKEVLRCAYLGCENVPRQGEPGAAEQGYCGLPNPVTGEPHLALTGFRWH